MPVPELGVPKYVWLRCPKCQELYYVDNDFWSHKYDKLLLHCPYCQADFDKNECVDIWKE